MTPDVLIHLMATHPDIANVVIAAVVGFALGCALTLPFGRN